MAYVGVNPHPCAVLFPVYKKGTEVPFYIRHAVHNKLQRHAMRDLLIISSLKLLS